MTLRFTCMLMLASVVQVTAQTKIKSIKVSDEITYATVDRPGELYITTSKGQIKRFDVEGNMVSEYNRDPITLFDPRDGARLFAYYRKDQHYAYLNPSFETTAVHTLDSSMVIEPWLACASGDHNLWIFDAADKTLKRINVATSSIDAAIQLTDLTDLSALEYMREYQGFLFLHHRDKGILVYSSMGRYLRSIGGKGVKSFNFIGEELYYVENSKINLFNLFTTETRELPLSGNFQFVLMTDERLYKIMGKTIEVLPPMH